MNSDKENCRTVICRYCAFQRKTFVALKVVSDILGEDGTRIGAI